MPRLTGIAIKEVPKGPMRLVHQADVTVEAGLVGDCRGSDSLYGGNRQITILALSQWVEACTKLRRYPIWTTRRANLLLEGVSFGPDMLGKLLIMGEVVLRVMGECKPCARMDEHYPGLMEALADWRGGATCRVIKPGRLVIERSVRVTLPPPT